MANKIKLKTAKNAASVSAYLNSVEDIVLRKDARALLKLFKSVTGAKPEMWGGSIVGFGEYTYYRGNGDEGRFMATGFSIRRSGPTLYIMPGYQNYQGLMEKLGPHKLGKSCVYFKNLVGIDLDVLRTLIARGLADLRKTHEVRI